MKRITFILTLGVLILMTSASAWGQGEPIDFSLDASLGMEGLEEPTAADITQLETNGYVTLDAGGLIQFYNLQTFLHAPLRFNTSDFGIREADWDDTTDWLRIFQCARIDYMSTSGNEERRTESGSCGSWEPDEAVGAISSEREDFTYLSARLVPIYDLNLGYGSIVDGYSATLEQDFFREGLAAEANINRFFIFSGAISDITDPTVIAARAAFRPVQNSAGGGAYGYYDQWGNWHTTETQADEYFFVEVGVTSATDLQAPTAYDPSTNTASVSDDPLSVGGVDARIRFNNEDRYSTESYEITRFEFGAEYNQIFSYSGGLHTHLRFYYDVGSFDFYIDGEYRLINSNYIPQYFNQHYRVQRGQFNLSEDQRAGLGTEELTMTKLDYLDALPDETHHAYATSMRFRFWSSDTWVQDGYEQSGWTEDVEFTLFAEHAPTRDLSGRAGVGMAFFGLADNLSASAQFVQQGWDDFEGLFSLANSVFEVDARYLLTPEIYLDIFFDQTWFDLGTELDTTNDFGANVGYLY